MVTTEWLYTSFQMRAVSIILCFKNDRKCINYRINYGNYCKEFDSHFSVRRCCKDCHLIAGMAFSSIKSLALKWNYFFLSGIIVFVEYFNLCMKQLGFNLGPVPAEGCHHGLRGLCLRGYQA